MEYPSSLSLTSKGRNYAGVIAMSLLFVVSMVTIGGIVRWNQPQSTDTRTQAASCAQAVCPMGTKPAKKANSCSYRCVPVDAVQTPRSDVIPEHALNVANVTTNTFSLWWWSKAPTSDCISVKTENGQDVKVVCEDSPKTSHFLTINNLEPGTSYSIEKKIGFLSVIRTLAAEEVSPSSLVAQGSVIHEGASPLAASNVVVFIYRQEQPRYVYPVAALTDGRGYVSIDVGQLDIVDVPQKATSYMVQVIDQTGHEKRTVVTREAISSFQMTISK